MPVRNWGPKWGGLAIVALLMVSVASPLAAEEPAKPRTPIRKELDTIRDMIYNANMKFRDGVAGVNPGGASVKATPAQVCCSGNLEYISKSMDRLREIVRDRTVCYERKRSVQDVEIATVANRDMRVLDSSLQLFAESENRQDVGGALESCTRAYLRMSETLEVLPECEMAPPAANSDGN